MSILVTGSAGISMISRPNVSQSCSAEVKKGCSTTIASPGVVRALSAKKSAWEQPPVMYRSSGGDEAPRRVVATTDRTTKTNFTVNPRLRQTTGGKGAPRRGQ